MTCSVFMPNIKIDFIRQKKILVSPYWMITWISFFWLLSGVWHHITMVAQFLAIFPDRDGYCIVKQWKTNMGYCFVLSAIMPRKVIHAICFAIFTVCWDLEMLLPWQHDVFSSPFYRAYPDNAVLRKPCHGMEKAVTISHWVPQKHISDLLKTLRQIGDRNAVYFIAYFQRFQIIIII